MWTFKQNIYKTRVEEEVFEGNCFSVYNPTEGSLTVEYTLTNGTQTIVGVSGGVTIWICSKVGTTITPDESLIVTSCGITCIAEETCIDCGATTQAELLGYSSADNATACANIVTPVTRYIPNGQDWISATFLYQNATGTIPANPGFYSDGAKWYYWDGSTFSDTGFC